MNNRKKYLKDGVDAGDLYCDYAKWREKYNAVDDIDEFVMFMESEVKPTLSEDEKVVLSNSLVFPFGDIFQTIGRNSRNKIYLTGKYCSTNYILKEEYQGLFQFIQPRRRI